MATEPDVRVAQAQPSGPWPSAGTRSRSSAWRSRMRTDAGSHRTTLKRCVGFARLPTRELRAPPTIWATST